VATSGSNFKHLR